MYSFDIYISCKSEDYALARELYDFLANNGYKPFLADTSVKEEGIDQYIAIVGDVINACQSMIVFATNADYIESPYVSAEWHAFVAGHKPDATIISVLSPDIDTNSFPAWLRGKQCFTTENYKDDLLLFLEQIDQGYEEIDGNEGAYNDGAYDYEVNPETNPTPVSFSSSPVKPIVNKEQKADDRNGRIGALIGAGLSRLFGGLFMAAANNTGGSETSHKKKKEAPDDVFSSIFAPAEIKRKSHMLVQVYLHLYEETEKVKTLAQESDKDAERRDYTPLLCKLKKGDKVDVQLNIYGETLLMSENKSIIWQGSFTKCSFDYFVPKDIDIDELSCMALLTVNGIPVGEMRFITRIVESPRHLNPEIIAHKYRKVFISYAHKDEEKVKSFHEGLKLFDVEHFYDRAYLKAGDVFPQVIQDYINSADLFVLFWSENASQSEYVEKERAQALELAFPQIKPQQAAKLSIYPMSIEPHAELPADMKDNYHFGEM